MSTTRRDCILCLTPAGEFRLRSAQGDRVLSVPESFAIGRSLVQSRRYATATRIFAALVRRSPGNPQLLTMLARCWAGLKDSRRCNDALKSLFGEKDYEAVARL